MSTTQIGQKPVPSQDRHSLRTMGEGLFGGIGRRLRSLRRHVADMLMRGDRDYAKLSALSQEIGRIRQKIAVDLKLRREERSRRVAARKMSARLHGREIGKAGEHGR
jgi:hypothetical protein